MYKRIVFFNLFCAALFNSFTVSVAFSTEIMLGKIGEGGIVLVWKDGDSMSKGYKLLQAGILTSKPELIAALCSCVVSSGTRAVVTDGGIASSTVMIIDGDATGCEGDVDNIDIQR